MMRRKDKIGSYYIILKIYHIILNYKSIILYYTCNMVIKICLIENRGGGTELQHESVLVLGCWCPGWEKSFTSNLSPLLHPTLSDIVCVWQDYWVLWSNNGLMRV